MSTCRFSFEEYFEEVVEVKQFVKVGRNVLVAHKNAFTLSHLIIEEDEIRFVNNYSYPEKMRAGIISIQDSVDEMHVALGVEVFERE